jgi:hypothetical protein
LVQDPAIESDFVYFDKEKVLFSSVDDEQRLVMGAILIPNKKILRIDGEGKPYHVFFKPEKLFNNRSLFVVDDFNHVTIVVTNTTYVVYRNSNNPIVVHYK